MAVSLKAIDSLPTFLLIDWSRVMKNGISRPRFLAFPLLAKSSLTQGIQLHPFTARQEQGNNVGAVAKVSCDPSYGLKVFAAPFFIRPVQSPRP